MKSKSILHGETNFHVLIVKSVNNRHFLLQNNVSRLGGLYGNCYEEDTIYQTFREGQIVNSDDESYDSQASITYGNLLAEMTP